jgi:hypothetical protein
MSGERKVDGAGTFTILRGVLHDIFTRLLPAFAPFVRPIRWERKRGDSMTHGLETTHQGFDRVSKRVPFGPLLAAVAATSVAFIFGLVATLSWQQCLVVVLAAGALAGGAVFTVLEMLRLGKESE